MAKLVKFKDGNWGVRKITPFGYRYYNFHTPKDPWRMRLYNPSFSQCKVPTKEMAKEKFREYDGDRVVATYKL